MQGIDFKKYWLAFLQWNGWKAFGTGCVKAWKAVIRWGGWKKLCFLPLMLALPLFAVCGVCMIWVFWKHMDQHPLAYGLYALSAYLLMTVCIRLPSGIRQGKEWLARHPKIAEILKNKEFRFTLKLCVDQFINFAYGIFKIVAGVIIGSAWIGCDGIYNMTQSLIQLFQILRRKYAKTRVQQWKSYRFCGVLILLMHLTLIGIVFQMVNWNRAEEHGEIMVITTALFAFYKLISSFMSIAKDRKHVRPVDSSIRMLDLAQAFFAIFSLQASMFHTFGTGEYWEHFMNILTGCGVCLLIVSIGIYMIRRGNREIKKLRESNYGE